MKPPAPWCCLGNLIPEGREGRREVDGGRVAGSGYWGAGSGYGFLPGTRYLAHHTVSFATSKMLGVLGSAGAPPNLRCNTFCAEY